MYTSMHKKLAPNGFTITLQKRPSTYPYLISTYRKPFEIKLNRWGELKKFLHTKF